MHWHKQVIALKAQQRTLQIFDLGQKLKLKSSTMNEDVLFWKWVSIDTLGLVTDTSVYHWNVFDAGQSNPIKIFERTPNLLVSSALFSYKHSPSNLCMIGLPNHQLPPQRR